MKHYELAIIGTGSGNSVIDDRTAGGPCLNHGCIPSKRVASAREQRSYRIPPAPTEVAQNALLDVPAAA